MAGNNRISVFKGIPYAKPPVGKLRWRTPEPADSWEGVKKNIFLLADSDPTHAPKGRIIPKTVLSNGYEAE